jgi:hypothetical protein
VLSHVFAFVAMLFAFALPSAISAQTFSGDGTPNNPYLISTVADLVQLATDVNADTDYNGKHFKLANNLNLDVAPYNSGAGWTPIGNYSKKFKGNFDGDGKTVSGLFINRSTSDDPGLFGWIYGGEVKNLGLENVNIKGKDAVGDVAGVVKNSSLSNCAALNPSVKATGSSVGRVVGSNSGGTLSNNIAWDSMSSGGTQFSGANTANGKDGEFIATLAIHTDGTLGSRFLNDNNPWTTANSRLPGFGTPVDMPEHLRIAPVVPSTVSATAGNAQVTLNWTASGDGGGGPITKYRMVPRCFEWKRCES